jgi:hypothetical protein
MGRGHPGLAGPSPIFPEAGDFTMDRESLYAQLGLSFSEESLLNDSLAPAGPKTSEEQFTSPEEMYAWASKETMKDFMDKGIAETDAKELADMMDRLPVFSHDRNVQIVDTIYDILESQDVGPVKAYFAIHSLLSQLMQLPSDVEPDPSATGQAVVFSSPIVGRALVDDAPHWIGKWEDKSRRLFSIVGGVGEVFPDGLPKPGEAVILTDVGDPSNPIENDFGVGIVVHSYQGPGSYDLAEFMRFNLYRPEIETPFTPDEARNIVELSSIVWDMEADPEFEQTSFEAVTIVRVA